MKKLLLLLFTAILFGCSTDIYKQPDMPNLDTYTTFQVPIQEGMISIVLDSNGDTLAITGVPMYIRIPILAPRTRTADIDVQYINNPEFIEYKNKGTFDEYSTICFEDTPNGDCDYNDLVLHIHSTIIYSGPKYQVKFRITPIAMGNTIPISLHFETFEGKVYTISEDCRRELFNSNTGFINTVAGNPKLTFKEQPQKVYELGSSNNWNNTRINWFIIANNKKLYVAAYDHSREYSDYVGTHGKPYGIVVPDIWNYYYPQEGVSMSRAYPEFDKWLKGTIWTFKQGSQNDSLLYIK